MPRWACIVAIDPALHGLGDSDEVVDYQRLPKELRSFERLEQTAAARAKRARLRAAVRGIDRLELRACRIQDAAVDVTAGHVVVVLPHAHVSPDEALACLRFDTARTTTTAAPTISVVQLPCCAFVWHATALGLSPHAEFLDPRIASAARLVRAWPDVSPRFFSKRETARNRLVGRAGEFELTVQQRRENKAVRQTRAVARAERRVARRRSRTSQPLCEDCHVKNAFFTRGGAALWCSGCAKGHASAINPYAKK